MGIEDVTSFQPIERGAGKVKRNRKKTKRFGKRAESESDPPQKKKAKKCIDVEKKLKPVKAPRIPNGKVVLIKLLAKCVLLYISQMFQVHLLVLMLTKEIVTC